MAEAFTNPIRPDLFNPDQFNPDQFNPDQLNPDQFNPGQFNPDLEEPLQATDEPETLPASEILPDVTLSSDLPASAIGPVITLPAPITGTEPMPPGKWADLIMTPPLRFPIAISRYGLRGDILEKLLAMKCINEPVLRWKASSNSPWDAKTLYSRINYSTINVEAAVMQCVGTIIQDPQEMCHSCSRRYGPFAFCVRVDGVQDCGNCHWSRQSYRCSFNTSLPARPVRWRGQRVRPEEADAVAEEIAELKDAHREILKLLASHADALENASDYYKATVFADPLQIGLTIPPSERVQALEEYYHYLTYLWIPEGHSASLKTSEEFGHLADKVTKTMARIEVLLE
ncbi:hypothetical protein N7466_003208 [Penicillium verhagenii]|uniref:uncharacterized protein n=1 Tax=Penicillium verhagenii TaxID=1562060 RepID=UPI00254526EF|nr:uncharacterized protein N7466_003208 [Penicillium verhagenii]KAJ5936758.1 hypothetical protein N7466_003208 [Penicillium verhagenii]